MDLSFLRNYIYTGIDFESVIRKCERAPKGIDPDNRIILYEKALEVTIRGLYETRHWTFPANSNPNAKKETDFKAFVKEGTPFAKWLNNEEIRQKCFNIINRRNTSAHDLKSEFFEKKKKDADKIGENLEQILRYICSILIRNPRDWHQPCVVLLDTSLSMNGSNNLPKGKRPIDALNRGIRNFQKKIVSVHDVNVCTEICFITFNDDVKVIQPFQNADLFNLPVDLTAEGMTVMNTAIDKALDMLETQKKLYKDNDIGYYRPYLILFSDGGPTDKEKEEAVKNKLRKAIEGNHVAYYPIAIGPGAIADCLRQYYPESEEDKNVIISKDGDFEVVFELLSNSIIGSVKNYGRIPSMEVEGLKGIKIERK